jgi:hypothetical protein
MGPEVVGLSRAHQKLVPLLLHARGIMWVLLLHTVPLHASASAAQQRAIVVRPNICRAVTILSEGRGEGGLGSARRRLQAGLQLRPGTPVVHGHLDRLDPAGLVHVAQDGSTVAQVGHPQAVLDTVKVQRERTRASEEPGLPWVLQALFDILVVQILPGFLEGLLRVARFLELFLELRVRVLA